MAYLFSFRNKKQNLIVLANYFLITYAFFAPISNKTSGSILIIISVLLLFTSQIKERFLFVIKDKVIQSFILFYLLYLIWMIGSENTDMALFRLHDYKFIFGIIIIAMAVQKEFIGKILTGFMLGMFISELLSYAMSFQLRIPIVKLTEGMGSVPFMESYTDYATALSIALGVIFYNLLSKYTLTIYQKSFYLFFFFTASLNIFIVASRIGYLLYAVAILSVLIFMYKKQFVKILIAGTLLITFGYTLAYSVSDLFKQRTTALYHDAILLSNNDFSTSAGTRAGYYYYSIEIIKNNFLFGVGAGDHIPEIKQIILDQDPSQANIDNLFFNIRNGVNASLHSEFLDDITQFGIIGLLVFLNIFYQLLKYKQPDRDRKNLQIVLVTTIFILSTATNIFNSDFIARIFLFLSALSLMTFEERKMSVQNKSI